MLAWEQIKGTLTDTLVLLEVGFASLLPAGRGSLGSLCWQGDSLAHQNEAPPWAHSVYDRPWGLLGGLEPYFWPMNNT